MPPITILIAPDSFKGSLSAFDAAEAMAAGVRRAWSEADVRVMPLSDGGEGFLDCLQGALELEERVTRVPGPHGAPRDARWLYDPVERRAWLETAQVVPLGAVEPARVLEATTRGVGELIGAVTGEGAQRISLGIGGTWTIDGGAGCIAELGAVLRDEAGAALSIGASPLGQVGSVDGIPQLGPEIELLCDVRSPMVGPQGASTLYGPQKGLPADQIESVDQSLRSWGRVLERAFDCDPSLLPFAGAGGGLAGALMAALGAVPRSGVERVCHHVGFDAAVRAATIVVTGEGRVDAQSREGKVLDHVLARAAELGRPVQVLAGQIEPEAGRWLRSHGARALALAPASTLPPSQAKLAQAHRELQRAAFELFAPES